MRSFAFAALAACSVPASVPARAPLPASPSAAACAARAAPLDDLARLGSAIVANVTVRVASGAPDDEGAALAHMLATTRGQPVDVPTLRADVRTLWKATAAVQIAVTAEPAPGGYTIAFEITPPRRVRRVELDGVAAADVPTLASLAGTLDDGARLARIARSTEARLRAFGYLHARIAARALATCDGVVVRVTGTLGPRFTIGALRIVGATAPVGLADLESDFGRTNAPHGAFSRHELEAAIDRVVARHQALGFPDATGRADVVPDERTHRLVVTVTIADGRRAAAGSGR